MQTLVTFQSIEFLDMKWWNDETLPRRDFPNRLVAAPLSGVESDDVPALSSVGRRGLVAVFCLALLVRLVMAARIDVLCTDSILFMRAAQFWEQGDVPSALGVLRLNIYPPILAAIHHLGVDWLMAGKLWGVTMGTLTVLPLFGWVRRQFDEPTALIAALLYACHPKFVQWSPELVRDQTFWFLAACTLYSSWRASITGRRGWFVAAGLALTFAHNTRFEGCFLLIPLALWTVVRAWHLPAWRLRLAVGLALSFAVWPITVGAVQWALLPSGAAYQWADLGRLNYVAKWSQSLLENRSDRTTMPTEALGVAVPIATESSIATTPTPALTQRESLPAELLTGPIEVRPGRAPLSFTAWTFVHNMRRGLQAIFALLMFAGMWRWRYVWFRCDQQPCFYVGLCVCFGVWVHLWYAHETSSRYALLIVLLGSPYAALALMWLAGQLARSASAALQRPQFSGLIYGSLVCFIAGFGCGNAWHGRDVGRSQSAALGRWLRSEYGPQSVLSYDSGALAIHYAGWTHESLVLSSGLKATFEQLNRSDAEFLILSPERLRPEVASQVLTYAAQTGFAKLDPELLPKELRSNGMTIFQRTPAVARRDSHAGRN